VFVLSSYTSYARLADEGSPENTTLEGSPSQHL